MVLDLVPAAVATVAALFDARWRRIPNWLTLASLGAGVGLHVAGSGATGALVALSGAAIGLGILLPFYVIGAIGAGDVKLLAALGALVGPQAVVSIAVYGAIVGGVISVVILTKRHQLVRSLSDIMIRPRHLRRSGAKAPYGVAIASGVYLAMLLPGVIG